MVGNMAADQNLPDYDNPPLVEVVFGIQFNPPRKFTSIDLAAIYEPFRADFPNVQEQPRLDVQIETFGGIKVQPDNPFTIEPAPIRGRMWFVSGDDSHLIQFQDNRLLLNWRRRSDGGDYPRFEGVLKSFMNCMSVIESVFEEKFSAKLKINQAELTYVNLINLESFSDAPEWVKIPSKDFDEVDSVSLNVASVVRNDESQPFARFRTDLQSVYARELKQKALRLSLVFRGQPPGTSSESCIEFFERGHELIVNQFDKLTTAKAHKAWGKH
jgi:uncharacterized protein (TIGR04255 family)